MRPVESLAILALAACLNGCSYLGTMVSQAGYSMQQSAAPEQRLYKHMLDRETFFVFGRITNTADLNPAAVAVIAVSDRFRDSEVVDVSHTARMDSYYGLNLPAGDFQLLVASDLDRDGYYDESEVIAARGLSLTPEGIPDRVLGGFDIDLKGREAGPGDPLRVQVAVSTSPVESFFYPKGTIRSLEDPIFDPQMASLGMYEPAVFMEAAPMMFYALEEDAGYKVPVVFVHGINGSARDFADIVARLDRRRVKPWFFHYPSGTDLRQLSTLFYKIFLSGKVVPLGDMPIVIVAHSMGGVVVRDALNLVKGTKGENSVQRIVTVASPLGGHPGARSAASAPVVIASWRNLNPDSEFIAELHRKPLPMDAKYHLLFAYGDDRTVKMGANSDGVVPLSSQLSAGAQKEASAQHGFNDTHTGILQNEEAIRTILAIVDEVRAPVPEPHLQALAKGGFDVPLGSDYTPLEAYLIRTIGHFMEAMASGSLAPTHPVQEHFVRAVRGEVAPDIAAETAWIKFIRDYPDRQALATQGPGHDKN